MHERFSDGNRLPVPDSTRSHHFFYKTQPFDFDPQDVDAVVNGIRSCVEDEGLNPSQIDAFGAKRMTSLGQGAAASAMGRLAEVVKTRLGDRECSPSITVCEWASPHTDPAYDGTVFLSCVLNTGPEHYMMQTFHSEVAEDQEYGTVQQPLKKSTRSLRKGDVVLFDPTTPHMAAPMYPNTDALLMLLQFELEDDSPESRAELLKDFPPMSTDKDEEDAIFSGLGV